MKWNLHTVAVIVGLLLVLGAFFAWAIFSAPASSGSLSEYFDKPAELKERLIDGIERNGGAETYALFKEENAKLPAERQHLMTHIMGEALHDALGVSGMTVCDSKFGFGCYHGFFGRAVAEGGEARIKELDAVCMETFGPLGTGCQHGIGHGILEYTGYERITDALTLCEETTQLVPLLGCTSGVFMEYNTPLVGAGDGLQPETRKFDKSDPYAPCPSVSKENSASCYYELGGWLLIALGSDYEKAGAVCAGLAGEDKKHCYLGIGSLAVVFNQYSVEAALSVCARFGEDDELSCRAGASWSLYANPEYRERASAACEPAKISEGETWAGEYTRECLKLSDLTEGRDSARQQ